MPEFVELGVPVELLVEPVPDPLPVVELGVLEVEPLLVPLPLMLPEALPLLLVAPVLEVSLLELLLFG